LAGVPEDLIIECHGHFRAARCIRCKKPASIESVKECIVIRQEVPVCTHCITGKSKPKQSPAYIKPDIVFFGEQLPYKFHATLPKDVDQADLCIVMGTSLQVPPTAYIPDMVQCNRVLLNREIVGNFNDSVGDVFYPGDCDDSIMSIARLLGWDEELRSSHSELLHRMRSQENDKTQKI
jgi:NAD-dependent SIR2 family protein deacetylase